MELLSEVDSVMPYAWFLQIEACPLFRVLSKSSFLLRWFAVVFWGRGVNIKICVYVFLFLSK